MEIFKILTRLNKSKQPYTLATVVDTDGSSPAKIGQKMVILENGKTHGTVGGGAIEKRAIEDGREMLKLGRSGTKKYELKVTKGNNEADRENVGMICGGVANIYYETFLPNRELYVFGGGHICQALGKLVDKDKYKLIVIDNRKEFANPTLHPHADEVIYSKYDKFSNTFKPDPNSLVVIVTHAHIKDYEILHNIYKRNLNFKYVGMIGSKEKVTSNISKLFNDLGRIPLPNLYSPIGLKIGGDSPYEIAVSIVAEIQSVFYNKKINHMKINYEKI